MRILVVTTEPAPLPGGMTTGAGLRAWALAQGLRCRGFAVELAMAADAVAAPVPDSHEGVTLSLFARERLTEHVRERKPDALVMQHWGLMDRLEEPDCPLAIDLAGPHLLERRFWGSPSPEEDLEQKLSALRRADFLCCSGNFQRHYFLAFAMQCGWDPADPALLPVIPFSLSPDPPKATNYDAKRFVYCGMLLPWQDPAAGIRALLDTLEQRGEGMFHFVGSRHPAGDVSRGRFDALMREMRNHARASLDPPRPFDELMAWLGGCGVALDLMARNPERELAFTSRTVVYMACGLPVIHDNYSELAGLIREYDAGWCLDPQDATEVARLAERLLDAPEEIARRRDNARRLVAERLAWDRTIRPLADWCAAPVIRQGKLRDKYPAPAELRATLAELSGRRLVRLSNWLRKFR